MKLGVIGSRTILDDFLTWEAIAKVRLIHPEVDFVVSGGADGPDSAAILYAKSQGLQWEEILPDYSSYGRKIAPLMRNTKIAIASDKILAVWNGRSKGTKDTIDKAKGLGKTVYIAKVGIVSLDEA